MSGKDKGKQGTILKVVRKKNAVIVENCKMVSIDCSVVRVGWGWWWQSKTMVWQQRADT